MTSLKKQSGFQLEVGRDAANLLVTDLSNLKNQVYNACINRLAIEIQLHYRGNLLRISGGTVLRS